MADVFLSYSRADKPLVEPLVAAFESKGWSVWWDIVDLTPGVDFDSATAAALNEVRAVVVVWTPTSVASRWVRGEARVGADRGILVPVRFEAAQLPIDVRAIHTTDLDGWGGDLSSPAFQRVAQSIESLVGARAVASLGGNGRLSQLQPPVHPHPTSAREPLLAVLPFDNLSADPEMTFFADGVSDEILQAVSRALKTIGRASSFQFRGADKGLRKVAAELRATHVLDGSVRRGEGMVRINAQLIDAESQLNIWQAQFDRPARDLFAVQEEIAVAVADALNYKLSPAPRSDNIDPATYEAYLRLTRRSESGTARSRIAMADEITRRAPQFGPGWVEAAQARAALRRNHTMSQEQQRALLEEIDAATQRATQLLGPEDPALTAFVVNWAPWTGAWTERESRLRHALERNPNSLSLGGVLGSLLQHAGRSSESVMVLGDIVARDPLEPRAAVLLGMALSASGRHEEAFGHLQSACRRWPNAAFVWYYLLKIAAIEDRWDIVDRWTTPDQLARHRQASGSHSEQAVLIAELHRRPDDPRRPELLSRLEDRALTDGRVKLSDLVDASLFCDPRAVHDVVDMVSFAHLVDPMQGFESGDLGIQALFTTAARRLRSDPRFVLLCARLGLAAHWIGTGRWPDCADHVPYDFRAEARGLAGTPIG